MAEFHFLRPVWLLLLLLIPLLPLWHRFSRQSGHGWEGLIPSALLKALLPDRPGSGAPPHFTSSGVLAAAFIVVTAVAMAGPSWREGPTPLQQNNDSLVVVLDMSLSMLATDSDPNRLTRAKRKVRDLLDSRQGALTGLIAYAGDAHVVTPLTDDTRTVKTLLQVLEPTIMPASGNRADRAVEQAIKLLERGAPGQGRILLIADSLPPVAKNRIPELLAETPYTLSTLVVGTEEGSPIPLEDRGFIRDNGQVVVSRANPDQLSRVANDSGGNSRELSLDSSDLAELDLRGEDADNWNATSEDRSVKRWRDDGYWLTWLLLPVVLLLWRRQAFITLLILVVPLLPRTGQALDWESFWQREDQRAPSLIREDPEQAAKALSDPEWRGTALYRSGAYDDAAEAFSRGDSALADYNRGNALAREGQLEGALKAYEKALEKDPGLKDAEYNRQLVEQLLEEQQKKQQQSDRSNGDNSSGKDKPGDQESSSGGQQPGQRQPSTEGAPKGGEQNRSGEQDPSDGKKRENKSTSAGGEKSGEDQSAGSQAETPGREQRPLTQTEEQWLRRIPDDPAGLMRRKFLYQYRERSTPENSEGDTPW